MRVLVTGGGGFVGAWVVRGLLAQGIRPRVMELGDDRTLLGKVLGRDAGDVEWISGDVSRRDDLGRAMSDCDRVIHLAGALGPICQSDPARAAEINYVGTLHLFALASESALPVVYASTALVHASDGAGPVAPGGHYGVFKLACELSAGVFGNDRGLNSIGIRPPVVYGFGRTAGNSAGLGLACRAAAAGDEYTIQMSGEIETIYVEDVAAAFVAAATAPNRGSHVGNLNGTTISVADFIRAIRRVVADARIDCTGKQHRIAPARPGLDILDLLPGLPHTPVAEGIAATIAHHRDGIPPVGGRSS